MPVPKSAADAISPAFERTKRLMIQPFRLATWSRLAFIAICTGEFANSGWNGSSNFSLPSGGQPDNKLGLAAFPDIEQWMKYLPYILIGIVAVLCVGLVWMYVDSVFRFVLFDAVLRERYGIREGWRRWSEAGSSYFLWQVAFGLVELAVAGLVLGLPGWYIWKTKIYQHAETHLGTFLLLGLMVFTVGLVLLLVSLLVVLAARDFVVPVMAMENVGVMEGWRRVLPMVGAEKGAYTLYVLMKIVLSIGSAILFGIAGAIVFLVLLIPAGIGAAAIFVAAKAAGLGWNTYTIAAAGALGILTLVAIFYVMGFVYAPGMVFFQAYTLYFLGRRYPALEAVLEPAPTAVVPPAEPLAAPGST